MTIVRRAARETKIFSPKMDEYKEYFARKTLDFHTIFTDSITTQSFKLFFKGNNYILLCPF